MIGVLAALGVVLGWIALLYVIGLGIWRLARIVVALALWLTVVMMERSQR